MKPGKTGIARIIDATAYSWFGIKAAFKHEAAFRQELFLAILGTVLACFIAENPIEFLLLVLPLLLLLAVELLNSAIEAVVDRIGEEHHELSGRAKDMGSAAVFTASGIALTSWAVILFGDWLW
ncbi:MAG: diacylglycerol kinase [Halioglobus sp.]